LYGAQQQTTGRPLPHSSLRLPAAPPGVLATKAPLPPLNAWPGCPSRARSLIIDAMPLPVVVAGLQQQPAARENPSHLWPPGSSSAYKSVGIYGHGSSSASLLVVPVVAADATEGRERESDRRSVAAAAAAMGRTPCCDSKGIKKGPWAPEEDKLLVDFVQANGPGNWRMLPKLAGTCSSHPAA
jgi:hypothetical protein